MSSKPYKAIITIITRSRLLKKIRRNETNENQHAYKKSKNLFSKTAQKI